MSDALILGGGPCGLGAAMLLARDGHRVIVLEKDPDAPPPSIDDAWERWERKGVAQFRQPHFLHARFRRVLDTELPDVRDDLESAGGLAMDMLSVMPPSIEDREPRPGDEGFRTLTARRPVLEQVLASAAEREPSIELRRGVAVEGLVTGTEAIPGVPHVTGVRTSSGEELQADLVVDALGRRSELPTWIRALGGPAPVEEAEDSGFTYYTRYFRSADGSLPEALTGLLTPYGSISLLTLPCDNGTWSVTIYSESGDRPLKRLRHAEVWTKVATACPLQAHWLDGEPATDVLPMSGIVDRHRRFVVDGRPAATGIVAVGDAWSCTNPSFGRGLSIGIGHVARLRDVVREHLASPKDLAEAWDAVTEAEFTPWYRLQVSMDRARHVEMGAAREGREPEVGDDPESKIRRALFTAMLYDADVFRNFLEVLTCQALPGELLARPGVLDRILEVADGKEPMAPPGPSREELLSIVA